MAIFDELKSVGKVLQEAGKIPQYQQILEVQEKLLEMQNRISELDKENKDLKEKLKIQESLNFESNAYWIKNGERKDGPFCSCCWDDDRKTIRMQPTYSHAYYSCPKCENKNVKVFPGRDTQPISNVFDKRNSAK
ncbi:MAG: hypothetical protein WCT19_00245 [Candidatus Paceibacterota bacterium]|jgi:Zn finger protein HypA/HybF involved in hydrogenase expression